MAKTMLIILQFLLLANSLLAQFCQSCSRPDDTCKRCSSCEVKCTPADKCLGFDNNN